MSPGAVRQRVAQTSAESGLGGLWPIATCFCAWFLARVREACLASI